MNVLKEFITSRRRVELLERENRRLRAENAKLRARLKPTVKKPTVADRTNKRDQVTPRQIMTEYLFGEERVNG